MTTAKLLDFPHHLTRQEDRGPHTAKILVLPRPGYPAADLLFLPFALTIAWLEAFK
jgi:hypothetical protein